MANKIQIRRGLKSQLPTLSAGELGFTTDTKESFVGTGSGNVNMGGSLWQTGTAMSGTSTTTGAYSYGACPLVKVGDMYLNTLNGNIYQCTTSGSGTTAKWTYKGCIKGATGGTGPTGADGKDLQAVYSTSPTQVGTWIDGNPIYRIAFKGITSTKESSGTHKDMYKIDLYNLINNAKGDLDYNTDYIGIINHCIFSHGGSPIDYGKPAIIEVQNTAYLHANNYYGYLEFIVGISS